jgi:hypothetical protein
MMRYHDCKSKNFAKGIINVDISSWPSLLDEGEWPWYIEEDAGHHVSTCQDIHYECDIAINMHM